MSTFIDTSAFLAICNPEDQRHKQAIAAWDELTLGEELLVTTNYIVIETTALLHSRHGVPAVRMFAENILPIVLVEWVDTAIHNIAMSTLLASSGKQSPSLVDCVSFEVIRKSKIDKAFVYDRHFEGRGLDVVGK